MASDLLKKRLLRQAGVSVLAGLLMSSAVLAEDSAADPAGGDVSVGIGYEGPDLAIDPVDPGYEIGIVDDGSEEPEVSIDPVDPDFDDGDVVDEGYVDYDIENPDVYSETGDETDIADDSDTGEFDGVEGDLGEIAESGVPCDDCDVEVTTEIDPIRGTEENERTLDGEFGPTAMPSEPVAVYDTQSDPGVSMSTGAVIGGERVQPPGRGGGRDGDYLFARKKIVK